MADHDSPGFIQQVIEKLRAIGAPPPKDVLTDEEQAKRDKAAGRRASIGNMSEVDRMANGLPPLQR